MPSRTSSLVERLANRLCSWKVPTNVYRKEWNVHNVPALVRFERTSEGVQEVGRLIEAEILDEKRLQSLLSTSSQ